MQWGDVGGGVRVWRALGNAKGRGGQGGVAAACGGAVMNDDAVCIALCNWIQTRMRERVGPGESAPPTNMPDQIYDNAWYVCSDVFAMFDEDAPDAATAIRAAHRPGWSWYSMCAGLDERTIGQLMQAGAAKFLR